MMNDKIMAVTITYNPDLALLKESVNALAPQVNTIIIFDNGSSNVADIRDFVYQQSKTELIENKDNEGLPINYNKAISICLAEGYEWLLTMDQDTVVPHDLIERYSACFRKHDIAIICPVMVDINVETEEQVRATLPKEEFSEVEWCISSASLNRVSILKDLGGFDEKLFIDYVDIDYCRNARKHNYHILRCNRTLIQHQIGNGRIVRILGRDEFVNNHPPIRKYYFFRNRVYFARKYGITLLNEPIYYRNLIKHFLTIFYERQRIPKLKAVCKGLRDGFKL